MNGKLSSAQRQLFADKLLDLGNLIFMGASVSPLLIDFDLNNKLILVGFLILGFLYFLSYHLLNIRKKDVRFSK